MTTFVSPSEPLEMIHAALRAMLAMRVAHDTWVLDEGRSEELYRLCLRLGVRYFSRTERPNLHHGKFRDGTKYGIYNVWLEAVGYGSYDFIATFDPDQAPEPEYLERTLCYFVDPAVGYVRSAQGSYNQHASFVASGVIEETFVYNATAWPGTFAANCHNVRRLDALREVGGFAEHAADDLLVAEGYRDAGWQGVYVPAILSRGLAPVDWTAYIQRQRRWVCAILDPNCGHALTRSAFTPSKKIFRYIQGAQSLLDGLAVLSILLLALLSVIGAPFVNAVGAILVLYAVTIATNRYRRRYFLDPAIETGFPIHSFALRLAKWPFTFAAFWEALRRRATPYEVASHAPFASSTAFDPSIKSAAGKQARPRWDFARPEVLTAGAILAVLAFLSALRGLAGTVAGTDSARHLMNGVFLYDAIRTGKLLHPVTYAADYYRRFPAISLPYHPPLYPLIEAFAFWIGGLDFTVARVCLAIVSAACAFLYVKLVAELYGSAKIGLAAGVLLFSSDLAQRSSQDIMLELPALLFILLAIERLRREGAAISLTGGLLYGGLAAAAVLTKQAIFLIPLPAMLYAIRGDWRGLARPGLWAAIASPSLAAAGLFSLALAAGWGTRPRNWAPRSVWENIAFYIRTLPPMWLAAGLFGCIGGWILFLVLKRHGLCDVESDKPDPHSLLLVWTAAAVAMILFSPAYDPRYFFFAAPPVIALCVGLGESVLSRFLKPAWASTVVLLIACLWSVPQLTLKPLYLAGPERIAEAARKAGFRRVLYFGEANGSFTFEERLRHPDFDATVLRGDKLFDHAVTGAELQQFARSHGIQALVVESNQYAVGANVLMATASMVPYSRVPIETSDEALRGDLVLYEFPGVDPNARAPLRQSLSPSGRSIETGL